VPALLSDPLGEVARKERRSLLGISVIAILVGWTGLVPEKIENFGITFAATERKALLWVSLGIVVYYFAAFILYAWSDYLSHSNKVHVARLALRKEQEGPRSLVVGRDEWKLVAQVVPVSWARIAFDFFVTGLVALFAIWSLWGAVHQVAPKVSATPTTPAAAPASLPSR
jgi:TRAP-type C4-dicarboxylate transport system permease small subunit